MAWSAGLLAWMGQVEEQVNHRGDGTEGFATRSWARLRTRRATSFQPLA